MFFLQVNPLIIFTFIYSCCFIKKLPLYFFLRNLFCPFLFYFIFFVSACVSLFTVSVFCTVTIDPRVSRAGEVGIPLETLWRGDSASGPALPRVT